MAPPRPCPLRGALWVGRPGVYKERMPTALNLAGENTLFCPQKKGTSRVLPQ